jgi:hypothetical protein
VGIETVWCAILEEEMQCRVVDVLRGIVHVVEILPSKSLNVFMNSTHLG